MRGRQNKTKLDLASGAFIIQHLVIFADSQLGLVVMIIYYSYGLSCRVVINRWYADNNIPTAPIVWPLSVYLLVYRGILRWLSVLGKRQEIIQSTSD